MVPILAATTGAPQNSLPYLPPLCPRDARGTQPPPVAHSLTTSLTASNSHLQEPKSPAR